MQGSPQVPSPFPVANPSPHTPVGSRIRRLQLQARNLGQELGHRAGVHVAVHSVRSSADLRRRRMLATLGVDLLFDIGANEGQYGLAARAAGYRGRLVSFEPQSQPRQRLEEVADADPGWRVVPAALGAEDGELELNVAWATGASSLLSAEPRHLAEDAGAAPTARERVPVRRLDDVSAEHLTPACTPGIKLDVQGYEHLVLAGAPRLLERVAYVECEMLLAPYYEGQATVPELIALLYGAGLRLAGTDHGHVDDRTGMVGWIDAVFVRHDVPVSG